MQIITVNWKIWKLSLLIRGKLTNISSTSFLAHNIFFCILRYFKVKETRSRKGIFKITKFSYSYKKKLLSKLSFKIGLSSRKNNNFSVFCHLLRHLTNLFIVHFYAHINTDLLQLSQRYLLLQNKFCWINFQYKCFRITWRHV